MNSFCRISNAHILCGRIAKSDQTVNPTERVFTPYEIRVYPLLNPKDKIISKPLK